MTIYHSLRDVTMPEGRSCVALGLFDGLHPGHRAVIGATVESAKKNALTPSVFTFTINHDHPASKPSFGCLVSHRTRGRLLKELGVTHMICPPFEEFCDFTPEEFIHEILYRSFHAQHLFCGENYHFGKRAAGDAASLARLGGELGISVTTIPTVVIDGDRVSSTRIRDCVAAGDMPGAYHLLGRPFSIDFVVIHGRRLGRTLDAPTINQLLPDSFVRPKFGVYASVTTVEGKRYPSVTNVGVKPTVGSDHPLAETCILDYNGEDLYEQEILVEFYDFLRDEQKFETIDALRAQIAADAQAARRICGKYATGTPGMKTLL